MQRVPSQPHSTADGSGRTLVPSTPAPADSHMESNYSQNNSLPQNQNTGVSNGSNGNQRFQLTNGAGGNGSRSSDSGNGRENGSGGNSNEDNGSASDFGDVSSEADDLPQVEVQMVPLSVIVSRLITYAYTELVTLVDTLPSRTEVDRRSDILKYTEHISDLLTKLLVLVRWAKNAPQIQKCQNVIAYLDSQNKFFEFSVDAIMRIFFSMPGVRMRNYDVANAVDVLTTGTYQRLPVAIKQAVPPQKLTKDQIRETLCAIDDIIRGRILRGEPIPLAMRQYKIANGRIVFTVSKEFEITLTLLQYEQAIPWHIVGVHVLVGGDKALPPEQQITVNTWQIVERAQAILIESSAAYEQELAEKSSDERNEHTGDSAKATDLRPLQLAQLYDFLHQQCLTVLLESIFKQAAVLRRTRWDNLLQVEMGTNRSMLTLKYWTSSRAATTAYSDSSDTQGSSNKSDSIVFRVVALPVPRPIHASAVDGSNALEQSPEYNSNADSSDFQRIERDRRSLVPKLGLCVTWSAYSGLVMPKVWTRTVSQASGLSDSGDTTNSDVGITTSSFEENCIVLDPEQVNTEKLLRQVTWCHACAILESLYESMCASDLFSKEAVDLHYVTSSGITKKVHELTREETNLGTAIPRLRAWYRQNEGAVDITVDTFTGRLVVRASEAVAASTSLSETMVGQLAEQLNRTPWRLAELLVDMRSSLALVDLDSLAFRSLGLRPQNMQGMGFPALPGFVLSNISKHYESTSGGVSSASHIGGLGHMSSAASSGAAHAPPGMATSFPLRVSQQEADALIQDVAGVDHPLSRIRFYMIEGTDGVNEQIGVNAHCRGEWYIMVAMTDRLRFRLVLLNPHPVDRLMYVVGQVISLQVDRLFYSVARRILAEETLDAKMSKVSLNESAENKHIKGLNNDMSMEPDTTDSSSGSGLSASEGEITEKVDAMLTGRTSIILDYINALASTCRARLALRLLQTQLTRWKIPYSFRLPSFSTSPHGHRAAVSKELSVVGLDRMGLFELDEQVPILYIPIAGLMRASPINWNVANKGVLSDESRRMVSIRIASDELDPSLRADLSSSTRVDRHRQAALAKVAGKAPLFADRPRATYASLSNSVALSRGGTNGDSSSSALHGTKQSLIGRHVVPCQVIASIPIALDNLPAPVAQAYSDAVYFGAHAAADGGYHLTAESDDSDGKHHPKPCRKREVFKNKGGYSKVVLVYKQVSRALQCLIRDWSEHHLMTHIGRHMYSWEQPAMRRVFASTTAYYPFNAGPYTGAVANMLGSWRGHQSTELVIQCIGSWFLSISCRVPYPFANEDLDKSMYPPDYEDSGGNDLSFHLTLADVDEKTNKIVRIASTWPWVFAHSSRQDQELSERDMVPSEHGDEHKRKGAQDVGFEVSMSLSRWLRTLQARLNLTGSPLPVLSMILHLMPINYIIGAISSQVNIRSLSPSLQYDSQESLIRYRLKHLLSSDDANESEISQLESKLEAYEKSTAASVTADNDTGNEAKPPADDNSYLLLKKLMVSPANLSHAFESVKGLQIMHMYTAADNIRLVFNSRYVVDLRLVSGEMIQISDAVGAAHSLAKQAVPVYGRGTAMAPAPLVTAATEPIPLFADWMEAVAREMKFEWGVLERHVTSVLGSNVWRDLSNGDKPSQLDDAASRGASLDAREKVRLLQRGMFRLRPEASKAERLLFKIRQLANRQNSSKSPTFVPLPPSAMLCSRLQLVSVLRSLMQWLVRSVHVRDQLGTAISRTQEIIEQTMAVPTTEPNTTGQQTHMSKLKEPLFSVKEKLVVSNDKDNNSAESKQVMIVGFTGARESVRCEFLMQAGVKGNSSAGNDNSKDESAAMPAVPAGLLQRSITESTQMDVDSDDSGAAQASISLDEEDRLSCMLMLTSELFSIPSNIVKVDLDVRIVPMNRPPNGITDAAATYLVETFKAQTTSFRQRAGVLVRILALPPQLVMDIVDVARKLEGKVIVCALKDGYEHEIRLDAGQSKVFFSLRICGRDGRWSRVYMDYMMLSGTAQIMYVLGPEFESMQAEDASAYKKESLTKLGPWSKLMDEVITKLDNETGFTRDMGKGGKSRWYDIIANLYEGYITSPLSAPPE
ncbi:mediator complex subunit [Coemansia umbellata]|nr:mediator complex subunit [Coemansia umbellata]